MLSKLSFLFLYDNKRQGMTTISWEFVAARTRADTVGATENAGGRTGVPNFYPKLRKLKKGTMKKADIFGLLWLFLASLPVRGQEAAPYELSSAQKAVKTSTTLGCLLPSAAGFAAAVAQKDWVGLRQLALTTSVALAANYALELSVKKDRPDHTEHHAMPSTHTLLAFSGAAFVQRRYGWKWGVPAYALSAYVAWGRVYSKRHDVWDVLAGAAIGVGSAYAFTRPLSRHADLTLAPVPIDGGCGLSMVIRGR